MTKRDHVEVTIYEKVYSHCPHCVSMRNVFEDWADEYDGDITATTLSAEDNKDKLIELEHFRAPVYVINRDGEHNIVSGYNPDALLDFLEGDDAVWGDSDKGCSL